MPQEDGLEHTPSSKIMGKRILEEVEMFSEQDECQTQTSTSKMPKYVEIKKEKSD